MAIVLSLISALAYGVSDFLGGLISRGTSAWQVAVVGQSSSMVCVLAVALATDGEATARDFGFAAAAGVCTGFGSAFLYRGLSTGRMGVVAPISAVGSALLPLAVGLGQGDRPTQLAVWGVVFAFPAIWLIARAVDTDPTHRGGVTDGVLAGLGFGGLFTFLGQVPESAGFAPLAVTQGFSVVGVILTAVVMRQAWVPRDPFAWRAVVLGPLGATATGAFLVATHHGLLSIVSVISALYPAATVLLAALVLRERIHAWQGVGLALAAVAVSLVALG